jgi:hypothetical protein
MTTEMKSIIQQARLWCIKRRYQHCGPPKIGGELSLSDEEYLSCAFAISAPGKSRAFSIAYLETRQN